jgi:hypothetical protein
MYIFDYYGTLKQKLPILGWEDLQVFGNTIVGRKDGKLLRYTTGTLQLEERVLPDFLRDAENIKLTHQGIFVLDAEGIHLYAYE